MDFGLKGRVALVAASSTGLGRAVAEELAAEGVSLILNARGAEQLEATRAAIAAASEAPVIAVPADVATMEGVHAVTEAALAHFGRVDILVTNAGGPPAGPFESLTPEAWENAFRLTLRSAVELTRAVLPGMKERRWGRIVNMTSITVKQPVDNLMLSNSLRAAVTGFAKTLSNEVASYGITVNNVIPGYTRTARLVELADKTARDHGTTPEAVSRSWIETTPAGRLGEPREIAAVVAFLASDRASYVNGISLPADGGWIKALY